MTKKKLQSNAWSSERLQFKDGWLKYKRNCNNNRFVQSTKSLLSNSKWQIEQRRNLGHGRGIFTQILTLNRANMNWKRTKKCMNFTNAAGNCMKTVSQWIWSGSFQIMTLDLQHIIASKTREVGPTTLLRTLGLGPCYHHF